MIKRNDIIEGLRSRGYAVEAYESIKNGTTVKGILFMEDNKIKPIVYVDHIIKNSTSLSDAIAAVLDIYRNAPAVDVDALENPDYIMQNLYIGLQKRSRENIVHEQTDFDGIEKYLYVQLPSNASFKVPGKFLEALKIHENEAWKIAEKNTFSKTEIKPFIDLLSEKMAEAGMEEELDELLPRDVLPLYVVTNSQAFRGASAILDKAALSNFADKCNVRKFIVLPSSIHEVLLVPADEDSNLDVFQTMVQEVNQTQVLPEERLADKAYVIEV